MKKFTTANYGNGNNAGKVNFFQHFLKDFLRPYGLATTEASGTPEDFSNKLKSYSCEWLCRPGIAFTADKPFEKLSEEFETIMDLCKCLQSPEAMSSKKMKKSIKTLMERVQNTSELFDAYQELFFSLGSSMYLTSLTISKEKVDSRNHCWYFCKRGQCFARKCKKQASKTTDYARAAKLFELCISTTEFEVRRGSYGQYCPISLNLYGELVDCSFDSNLEFAVEFRSKYYKTSSKRNMEIFLANPEKFVEPLTTRSLPPPEEIPKRRTRDEAKAQFPKQIELNGYSPVTFCDGKLRYEALVEGNSDLVVEFKEKLYIFQNEEKLEKFMKIPSKYSNLKLPNKLPPKKEATNRHRRSSNAGLLRARSGDFSY
ncbi:unnamed protein product [Clavelina lepadiformis]|uniref:Cilia- and flagella-associated protein 206 n=1 Tax=Clavelina lepadiformis TaxID=159417 RepID=A0ABP0G2F0_CLALP